MAMFMCVNVNAAANKATASKKVLALRAEQDTLQNKAIHCNILDAMCIYREVEAMDRKIEALIPSLLAERESLRDAALACGNDVESAMILMREVITLDNLLEELGYEEPADDECCVDE